MYHFNGAKYITQGIQAKLGPDLQLILWELIQSKLKELHTLDYLQVFELDITLQDGQPWQQVNHRQEVPPFSAVSCYQVEQPVRAKVYVIDDVSHARRELPLRSLPRGRTQCHQLIPPEIGNK